MRSFRSAVLGLASLAAIGFLPSTGAAQSKATGWQDSWYWGVYGGQISFPTSQARTTAPTIGLDWVITRTRYALNVFAEQSYFNAISTIPDFPTAAPRKVDIQDLRRVGFSAFIFLPELGKVKPYFGAGYAFNFIKSGTPEGNFYATPQARDTVLRRVEEGRTQGKMFGKLGGMWVYGRFAPFLEYAIMPTQGEKDWMINGDGFTSMWSVGLRYNFGTSIEKKW